MSENLNPELLNTADGQPELNSVQTTDVRDNETNAPAAEVAEETRITTLEIADEPETGSDDQELEHLEEEEHTLNFNNLSKEELVAEAKKLLEHTDADAALKTLKAIKAAIDMVLQEEYNVALNKFIEEGGEKDDFEFKSNIAIRDAFDDVYRALKKRKADEKARQEAERLENLKKKEDILARIKKLVEEEETEGSLKQLKELQTEFKQIRNVPKEHVDRLWETYHILVHKFYDRLSIFNELKDLDRKKNLDQKIELIQKVSELAGETSAKRAIILLKKYQEDWRGIGPVPAEHNEEIWNRFRQQCDAVYAMIKAVQAEQEKIREQNLEAKKEVLAKALELSNFNSQKPKEWVLQTETANKLMEEWKQIGMVPLKYRESLWEEFRNARNRFYTNKNNFFKALQAERNKNLKLKTELCEKAEAIAAHPIDWMKQTDELKKLQEAWKSVGFIHDKLSEPIWKRFRTACDSFFEKKAQHFATQVEEQKQNLEVKKLLIMKLEALLNKEDGPGIIDELKQIQESWNQTGFVPMSEKEKINKQYSELNDKVFQKFKQASDAVKAMRDQSHFEALLNSPNGLQKVKREERIVIERIKGLQNDILTWDNNLGFFSKGNKGENPMAKQIEDKIAIAQKHIAQLEEKLKLIRSIIKKAAQPQA
jgi:DNA-binding transcriptional regulator of glucitol operon/predicted CopG family antitoxin